MAKSPEQILANYREHAARSRLAFDAASKSDIAALNVGQGLKAFLMQALIGWRCGICSPVNPLQEGLAFLRARYATLQNMDSAIRTLHVPHEKSSFMAFLVNEIAAVVDDQNLVADRLLDSVLGNCLTGEWDEGGWESGMEQLRRTRGSKLAVESYLAYRRLLYSSTDGDVNAHVEHAVSLFEKRKRDGFYGGGEGTDGGGLYNPITVDYRLAAIMKRIRCQSESIHGWRWDDGQSDELGNPQEPFARLMANHTLSAGRLKPTLRVEGDARYG